MWVGKIEQAIKYIEANLFGQLNAESVGRAINYAPSSFSNLFSALTGYSVGEYIRFRRLSRAAELLVGEGATVTALALECGYETTEAFSKAFKNLFGCAPSQYAQSEHKHRRFSPISLNFTLNGGFSMTRNLVPGLQKVDWSDTRRQSEYVNSVVSALGGLGEKLDYDYVCALSGSAFRTSFSKQGWNHGNYHVVNTPVIIAHTFKMLGYNISHHAGSDFAHDSKLVVDSIDRGVPVVTLEGVINCSDACLISGYDNDGGVLLGYNPFMYVEDDHSEAPDDTGYFRKSDWRSDSSDGYNDLRILIIGEKSEKPDPQAAFNETLKLVSRLILEETLVPGQHNGIAAHRAFANALLTYEWDDNFGPYLNVMCNYKQYLDRQYAVEFLRLGGRDDLAALYAEIAELCAELGRIVPQDFSAGDMFSDKAKLKPYCDVLLEICALEERAAGMI